jgi:hypothetical protein
MNRSIFTYLSIFILLISCSDFEELNQNPNEPTSVGAGVLFTNAIRNSVQTTSNEAFLLSNNIAQLTGKALRLEADNYNWNAFPTLWEGLYGSLTDVEGALLIAESENNQAMKGALLVLKSWIYSQLTNAYGDIPYSEAIKGGGVTEANLTPKYDSQQAIYTSLLADLENAATLLNSSGTISGDILYNGDASKWIKFSNALRLRLLMYMSKKADVSSQFKAIVDGSSLFSSNDDQAALTFLRSFPNEFPTLPLKSGDFIAVAFSKSSKDVLSAYSDPRLSRYARPDNGDYANPTFSGLTNGDASQSGSRLGVAYYDFIGDATASQMGINYAQGIIMTYAEQELLLAEAAYNNWIDADAELHYKNGIKASQEYYQVDYTPFGFSDFEDFYANSGVALDEKIDVWEQKWLALYFTAMDPYFEVRRWYVSEGGFDNLRFLKEPYGRNFNDYKLPLRFLYPFQEQSLNQDNYNEANGRYSASKLINGKMWIVSD